MTRPRHAGHASARCLRRVALISPGIDLERRTVISHRGDLLKVICKEGADRSRGLVLMYVAQLMRDKPIGHMAVANVDAMPERDATSAWPDEPGLFGDRAEF
jgi:hypothetical protein